MEGEQAIEEKKVTLVEAVEEDISEYIEIEKKVEGKTYHGLTTQEEVKEEFTTCKVYMIKEDGKSIGSVSYKSKEDGSIYISGLAVDPDYQGRGYGKFALEKVLAEIGNKRAWLVTHPENDAAINVYQSFGFVIKERKENYYGDGEVRLILERDQI